MSIQQPTDENIVSGVKQGQTLGVTEMASSTPQDNDNEILVAGLLDKLVSIPTVRTKVKEIISDAPDESFLNIKKKKDVVAEEDTIIRETQGGKIEPTIENVDETIAVPKGGEKFELNVDDIDIDFDKIVSAADFQNVIKQYTDNLPTPKVQKNTQTKLLAEELDIRPSLLSGAGFKNAEEVYAARVFVKQSGEYLIKLANDVINDKTGNQLLQLKFKKHLATHGLFVQQFMKGRANVGRALQAFQIPTMKDAGDQKEMIDLIITQQGGSKNIINIAEQVKKNFDLNGMPSTHKLVTENWFQRASKAWGEAYRGGLLFSPKTMLRNVIGNAAFIAYSIPEYTLAGIYGSAETIIKGSYNVVRGRHWGSGQGGMTWEMGTARLYGMMMGFTDAFKVANKSFRTGQPGDAMSKFEGANSQHFTAENLGIKNGYLGNAIDFMGKVYRLPYSGLQYGDEFFKEIARSMEMHTLVMETATRISRNENISFKEAMERSIMEVAENPNKFQKELDEAARYYSFQDKLPGSIEKYVTAIQSTPLVGTMFLPFAKTPVNVTRRVIDLVNIGVLDKRFYTDQKYRTRQLARFTMAGGAFMAISNMYATGRITGGYPINSDGRFDSNMKNALDALGWKPYSIVFAADDHPEGTPLFDENGMPTGDHIYVSYQGLEPIGAFLGVTAHTMELMHRSGDPEVRDSLAMALTIATMEYLNNMPMIESLSNLVSLSAQFKFDDVAKDMVTNLVSAPILPLAPATGTGYLLSGGEDEEGKFNIVARNTDLDFERDMELFLENGEINMNFGQPKNKDFFNPLIEAYNQFLYKLPYDEAIGSVGNYIWGKDINNQELPPKFDVFGNEISRSSEMGLMVDIANTYFSPLGFKKVESKPRHYHENERLGGIITNPGKTISGVALNPYEYADFIRLAKQTKRKKYKNLDFDEYLEFYMNSQDYLQMTDVDKIKNIRKINTDFINLGKKDLLRMYSDTLGEDVKNAENAIDRGIPFNNNILEEQVQ
jgi:hypothetical protein